MSTKCQKSGSERENGADKQGEVEMKDEGEQWRAEAGSWLFSSLETWLGFLQSC